MEFTSLCRKTGVQLLLQGIRSYYVTDPTSQLSEEPKNKKERKQAKQLFEKLTFDGVPHSVAQQTLSSKSLGTLQFADEIDIAVSKMQLACHRYRASYHAACMSRHANIRARLSMHMRKCKKLSDKLEALAG